MRQARDDQRLARVDALAATVAVAGTCTGTGTWALPTLLNVATESVLKVLP